MSRTAPKEKKTHMQAFVQAELKKYPGQSAHVWKQMAAAASDKNGIAVAMRRHLKCEKEEEPPPPLLALRIGALAESTVPAERRAFTRAWRVFRYFAILARVPQVANYMKVPPEAKAVLRAAGL